MMENQIAMNELSCSMCLSNEETESHRKRTCACTGEEAHRIPGGIVLGAYRPKLQLFSVILSSVHSTGSTYITSENGPDTARETHDALSDTIGETYSLRRCH